MIKKNRRDYLNVFEEFVTKLQFSLLMMADPIYCDLSQSQNEVLEKLRKIMSEELREFEPFNNSFVLYRFLKARDWDVTKAELMLKKCIQWRRHNNLWASLKEYKPTEFLQNYISNMYMGTDKEGCPVFYVPLGKCDAKGFLNASKLSDVIKTLVQIVELHELGLEKKGKEEKRWLNGALLLLDFRGLTFANATNRKGIETIIRIFRIVQDIFPERIKAAFVINAPSILSIPFRIVKRCLSYESQEKIQYFSTEGWQEKLLELIDADQLPAFMGGTRTDPDGDPSCKTILCQMGIVDESYYLDRNYKSLANSPEVSTMVVPRSSTKKILLQVENDGSVIEWEIEVKAGNIGFSLYYEETPDQVRPVVVLEKVDAKDYVETGMHNCEKSGNYYVEFDNSYSWFRSKEILYILKVYPNELEMG